MLEVLDLHVVRNEVVEDLFLVLITYGFPTTIENLQEAIFDLLFDIECLHCCFDELDWPWFLILLSDEVLL